MKTILVVEDDEIIREDVAEILSLANYNILTAVNGKEGIEFAEKVIPDLIISDIAMPVVDGMGMLHVLRRNTGTENIPFIFLTSKHERNAFRSAMESGADDYITKPFNGDELLKAVENRFHRVEVLRKSLASDVENSGADDADNYKTLESLLEDKDTNTYQKRQVIYKEGHVPHYLYYIVTGKVRTYKVHDDGKQLVMGLYNAGDFLGHIAILEETPYKEMAEAMEETELTLIPRKEFEMLLHKNYTIGHRMIKLLAKNITENENQLLGIAYNTLRKKVAQALTNLQKAFHKANEPYYIDLSRDELASIAGTATESLIRTLTEFKNEKLIEIYKDNKIEILNEKKLRTLLR